jgi:ABC-type uncharacterized transport system auxiliary subunit
MKLQFWQKVTLAIILILFGCAEVPTQEMSDARLAIKAARDVKADKIVPQDIIYAEQNLARAEQELVAGQMRKARYGALIAKSYALDAHRIAIAIERARTVWQEVAWVENRPIVPHPLLIQAEASAQENDVNTTLLLANEAFEQGEKALNQAYLKQIPAILKRVKACSDQLNPAQLYLLERAETTYRNQQGKMTYQLLDQLPPLFLCSPP